MLFYYFLNFKGKGGGGDSETYYRMLPEDDSSVEVSSPRDPQSPILTPGQIAPRKDSSDKSERKKVYLYLHCIINYEI